MATSTYKRKFWGFIVIRTIANTLIISGILLAFISFWPFISAEISYWWDNFRGQQYVLAGDKTTAKKSGFGDLLKAPPPIQVVPVSTDLGIVIEKIDVNAPILANVDSSNYKEYIAALAKGVAHARGTALPGAATPDGNKNVFLFAHSAINPIEAKKYNSVFYLLRKLEVGDRIVVFYKKKRFDYFVFDKRVVQATDVKYITDKSSNPILTLQTCDPPGSSLRRLIVTARLAEAN